LKLSNAVLLGLFKSQIILVSPTWLPEGRPDENLPVRMGITVDQFIEASRSSILGRWIAPTADVDLFIGAYLQNMAITNSACSDWLLQEGYDLPPWLTTVDCAARSRPGAKPRYDWLEGKAFASKVFAERGDISAKTDTVSYLEEVVSANNLEGFKDVFWNLGQIVAWVETRSPFPVDALSDSTKDLARRDHSMPPGLPHHAAEFADRCADENGMARIKPPFQSRDDVRRAVLRSFQSGLLTASGQRRGSFDRELITPLEWADLTMDDSLAGEMTVRHREGWAEAWNDVRVKGDDVVSAFPMPTARPESVRIVASRKGRAPTYDWSDAMEFAVKQLDERGDFSRPEHAQAGWRSQADLMRLVIDYMTKFNDGNEPPESTVKYHLKTTIAEWRLSRK
jgi:hypothetical protein